MNKSEDYLKSIKSRMGWQVGLQVATLFAIGGLNSSIKEECGIIAEEIKTLSENTAKGLDNVKDAVQSLEASLIFGIEELKWILGSIDDKLQAIIGLIQFPKSTESNEKYLIGYELFKTECYTDAIKQFDEAIKLSPLNLNARIGLYLSKLKTTEKPSIDALVEIAKLTNADFHINNEVPQDVKDASIIFFTNFVSAQLCYSNEFAKWIELYNTVIPSVAKNNLTNKIRLIEALINTNNDYTLLLNELFNEGSLGFVIFGLNYKNTKAFTSFVENCFKLSKELLFNKESRNERYNFPILLSIQNFFDFISTKEGTFALGKANASRNIKIKLIETIDLLFDSIPKNYAIVKETAESLKKDSISVENIIVKNVSEESDMFLSDSFRMISDSYHKVINEYKTKELHEIENKKNNLNKQLDKLENGIPELDHIDHELCVVICTHFEKFSKENKKKIDFAKVLEKLLKVFSSTVSKE